MILCLPQLGCNAFSSFSKRCIFITTTANMQKGQLRLLAILSGLLFFFLMMWWNPLQLSDRASQVLAVAVLMITWWVTEALPMPAVALLPLIMFPLLGIVSIKEVAPH